MENSECRFLAIPEELVEKILSCMLYDELSRHRLVCKYFDRIIQRLLNQGLAKIDRYHALILKTVKGQLPRRESERRNHPLARHVDILGSIETRLSLLNMTYTKFIDTNACCFIPGRVLDETARVLRYIETAKCPPRAHELLQELRDISSMAMEHFDEKIAPNLRTRLQPVAIGGSSSMPHPSSMVSSGSASGSAGSLVVRGNGLRHELFSIKANLSAKSTAITSLRKELNDTKLRLAEHRRKSLEHDRKITELENQMRAKDRLLEERANQLTEHQSQLTELNRKMVEYDQKLLDVMSGMCHVRTLDERPASAACAHQGSVSEDVASKKSAAGVGGVPRKAPSATANTRKTRTSASSNSEPEKKRKRCK